MLRASLLVLATALVVPLSVVVACNDVETKDAPDAGQRICKTGPFVFDDNGLPATGLGAKPSDPACSADGTNLDVINQLPRGGWYPVGWKVQIVGTDDPSGQGECKAITVCTCLPGDTTPPTEDGGAPTTGEAQWQCG